MPATFVEDTKSTKISNFVPTGTKLHYQAVDDSLLITHLLDAGHEGNIYQDDVFVSVYNMETRKSIITPDMRVSDRSFNTFADCERIVYKAGYTGVNDSKSNKIYKFKIIDLDNNEVGAFESTSASKFGCLLKDDGAVRNMKTGLKLIEADYIGGISIYKMDPKSQYQYDFATIHDAAKERYFRLPSGDEIVPPVEYNGYKAHICEEYGFTLLNGSFYGLNQKDPWMYDLRGDRRMFPDAVKIGKFKDYIAALADNRLCLYETNSVVLMEKRLGGFCMPGVADFKIQANHIDIQFNDKSAMHLKDRVTSFHVADAQSIDRVVDAPIEINGLMRSRSFLQTTGHNGKTAVVVANYKPRYDAPVEPTTVILDNIDAVYSLTKNRLVAQCGENLIMKKL